MSWDDPFAPPPEAYATTVSGYAVAPVDPRTAAAARPPAVPPYPRFDPYEVVGWSTSGGALAIRVMAVLLVLVLPLVPLVVGGLAEETSMRRYQQRHYVLATGTVVDSGDPYEPILRVHSPETGDVDVLVTDFEEVYPGDRVRVLLARDDPSEYLLYDDRARPDLVVWLVVAFGLVAGGLATAVVTIHVRRRSRTDGVEGVAARLAATGPPPPLPARARVTGAWRTVVPAVAGVLLTACALLLLAGIPGAAPEVDRRTVTGTVTAREGRLHVSFYDLRKEREWTRPLSEREAAGREAGDPMQVTYLLDPWESYSTFGQAVRAGYGVLFLLAGVPLTWRGLGGVASMSGVTRQPPRAVEVVAWPRVPGKRPVLMVTRPGETRARKTVAVPLRGTVPVPAAITGPLWLHGDLRPGRWVVLRTPDGGGLAPAGPVRGSLGVTVRSDPAAPVPPAFVAAPWAPPPPPA